MLTSLPKGGFAHTPSNPPAYAPEIIAFKKIA